MPSLWERSGSASSVSSTHLCRTTGGGPRGKGRVLILLLLFFIHMCFYFYIRFHYTIVYVLLRSALLYCAIVHYVICYSGRQKERPLLIAMHTDLKTLCTETET